MDTDGRRDITEVLLAWRGGDDAAVDVLMPLVYRRLKEIAQHLMRSERKHQTLDPTALVHEAFMRLVDLNRIDWHSRAHFFALSARMMRHVLVDRARYNCRNKRGAGAPHQPLGDIELPSFRPHELVALDDALEDLGRHDAEMARVVELRFFGGLDRIEIAEVLGTSRSTVARRWRTARAWLINYLQNREIDR